jgi:hypothetical protein
MAITALPPGESDEDYPEVLIIHHQENHVRTRPASAELKGYLCLPVTKHTAILMEIHPFIP